MGVIDIELLIVVKSYPNPSQSLGEASCVVGICKDRGFVRIYPIPFRKLEDEKQFAKYETVRLQVQDPRNDPRPNTFRPQVESIRVVEQPLTTKDNWRLRKEWVMPLVSTSMCEIQREQERSGLSMGFFKPAEVIDVTQEEEDQKEWSAKDLAKLEQKDFFMTKENKPLEKLPYKWRYRYRCSDPDCTGHHQSIIDWELGQLYRTLKRKGLTDPKEIHEKIREKFLHEICAPDRDVHFFTGNMLKHPKDFLILGVFWPRTEQQMQLL